MKLHSLVTYVRTSQMKHKMSYVHIRELCSWHLNVGCNGVKYVYSVSFVRAKVI